METDEGLTNCSIWSRSRRVKWRRYLQVGLLYQRAYLSKLPFSDTHCCVCRTRTLRRLRSPTTTTLLSSLAQLRESLDIVSHKAYLAFLAEITEKYYGVLRDVVNKVATMDSLCSLACLAMQEGYVRPEFLNVASRDSPSLEYRNSDGGDEGILEIEDGRHPMIEKLRDDPFVPNSLSMSPQRHKIITGPNMGGKSSVVRMVALCVIMAQVGSYVPATSMRTGVVDGVFVRMGGEWRLSRAGGSTKSSVLM
jgi:DNA mismatch repair protein MSH3